MGLTSGDYIKVQMNRQSGKFRRGLPEVVAARARSAGAVGEEWLAGLDDTVAGLERKWGITVGGVLSGGSHAFAALADGKNGEKYVLKIDIPEENGGEFSQSMTALELAGGRGYAKVYAYDPEKKACLLERLGKPLSQLGYSVSEQMRIICGVLQKTWEIPVTSADLPNGEDCTAWFRSFIGEEWEKLGRPCSRGVIEQAFSFLKSREADMNPVGFVFIHGDAHNGNTLAELSGGGFKLIDPDGVFYEKAYDLGVLMREWVGEYELDPLKEGLERCGYLSRLTGVPGNAIWEWGFLQTVSTALILLETGREELGRKMLRVAECWATYDYKTNQILQE